MAFRLSYLHLILTNSKVKIMHISIENISQIVTDGANIDIAYQMVYLYLTFAHLKVKFKVMQIVTVNRKR